MAPFVAPPDPQALLPPLLACLPTAFLSTRPPPALLPLLSPILRQRLQYLPATSTASEGSWLTLLCWDATEAPELVAKVETTTFEPHPVSGEIELGEVGEPRFRRRDEETLQSLLKLPEHGLSVIYVWCENDEAGGGPGWRVSEVGLLERANARDKAAWEESVAQANARFEREQSSPSPSQDPSYRTISNGRDAQQTPGTTEEDDYWAQYDATPSRTPAFKSSQGQSQTAARTRRATEASSDDDYFALYGDVQPAMDNHDPDHEENAAGDPSFRANELGRGTEPGQGPPPLIRPSLHLNGEVEANAAGMVHVRTVSPSSQPVVAHLEDAARHQSHSEMAVQQHIGASIKSLYRLAYGAGMETSEFKRLVRTELDLIDLLEED